MIENSVPHETVPLNGKFQPAFPDHSSVLDLLPVAVYFCDASGTITGYNEKAVELWGYRPDIHENAVKFCACFKVWMMDGTFVPPEQTPMAIALATGRSFKNVEALVERPDGSKFYACVNINPVFDENKKLTGAINVFHDITTIKTAEFALNDSEQRYGKLVNSLSTPIYTTDAHGGITLYNRAAAELWGRDPEIGKDKWCGSFKIFKPDGSDLPLEECPMAVCLKEQRSVFGEEILVVRPDGSIRHVVPHPQPLFDEAGKMIGAVNMLVDITELKRHETALLESENNYRELVATLEKKVEAKTADLKTKNDQLKRSEERYHKMVEEVEDYAIILLDKDGIVQNWNKGAEKIKGYKEEEIVGRSFENFYREEDKKNGLPQILLNEAREKGKALHEGWRRRKDGTGFWGSIVLTALHDEQNRLIGFSKVTRDLTDKKLTEDKMNEYTRQLEFQNRELEQFAYAASHDLKEPLRKIHFYNSFIATDKANQLDDRSKEFLSRSLSATKRMTELIEDLLAYSRTAFNTENFTPVDLNEIMEEIKLMHKDELEQKNVSIEVRHLPTINGISFQMKQLLNNLISNSVKYRHPERELRMQVEAGLVKGADINIPEADKSRDYHRISISDNGIGFNMEHSQRIFNIFQRLTTTSAQGSGVGLAICKRIVQNHQGFITATGKENEGARFDVYLPVHHGPAI